MTTFIKKHFIQIQCTLSLEMLIKYNDNYVHFYEKSLFYFLGIFLILNMNLKENHFELKQHINVLHFFYFILQFALITIHTLCVVASQSESSDWTNSECKPD